MDSGSNIRLKTPDEIKRIQESCLVIRKIFQQLSRHSLEGISTYELDRFIESIIHSSKAKASFKLVHGYYHATCISLNNEVVHGIPSKMKIIRKGDLVKVDVGVVKKGYFGDACRTLHVPVIEEEAQRLIDVTRRALEIGVANCFDGNRLGTLGWAIQTYAENEGFSVVREFTGHGVGFAVHESPIIFHYGDKGRGQRIREGMVLAVEPIINAGIADVEITSDGWTAETLDGHLSAQFEDTIAVTRDGPVVLT